jgi:hypothetical protein
MDFLVLVSIMFRPADSVSVVPRCETLVAIRVLARVDENQSVIQSLAKG